MISMRAVNQETNKVIVNLRMIISPDKAKIENVDLLRMVIEGEDIRDWVYKEIEKEQEKVHLDLNLDALEKDLDDDEAHRK